MWYIGLFLILLSFGSSQLLDVREEHLQNYEIQSNQRLPESIQLTNLTRSHYEVEIKGLLSITNKYSVQFPDQQFSNISFLSKSQNKSFAINFKWNVNQKIDSDIYTNKNNLTIVFNFDLDKSYNIGSIFKATWNIKISEIDYRFILKDNENLIFIIGVIVFFVGLFEDDIESYLDNIRQIKL